MSSLDAFCPVQFGYPCNTHGLSLLSAFNPQGEVRHKVHRRLVSAGLMGPADQVARSLYNIEIARNDRTVIYETPEGYGLRRGSSPIEMFSNFVVRMNGNVAFGDQSSLHHSASILVGGAQHETVLPTRLLDQPRELVEHIHQILTLKRNVTVPMMRDPNSFRSVSFYLRGLLHGSDEDSELWPAFQAGHSSLDEVDPCNSLRHYDEEDGSRRHVTN